MEMGKEHFIEVKNVLFKVVTHMTMENQIGIQIIILWTVITSAHTIPRICWLKRCRSNRQTAALSEVDMQWTSLLGTNKLLKSRLSRSRLLGKRLLSTIMHHHHDHNHSGNHHDRTDADSHNQRSVRLFLLATTEVLGTGVLDVRIDLASVQSSLQGTENAIRRNHIRSEVNDHVSIEAQMEETRLVEVVVVVEHDSVSTDVDTHELPSP